MACACVGERGQMLEADGPVCITPCITDVVSLALNAQLCTDLPHLSLD
jgi:hypothetical protein